MTPAEYKAACEATGLSVSELADLLGVARSTIYRRWEPDAVITVQTEIAIRSILKLRSKKSLRNDRALGREHDGPTSTQN